ncbi:hypothetical protein E4T56_gene3948 [Termitomyces sp. T112]|nr:hypothetical protein E4T56_gene3948 [Termitomyces sp. T112]
MTKSPKGFPHLTNLSERGYSRKSSTTFIIPFCYQRGLSELRFPANSLSSRVKSFIGHWEAYKPVANYST